jgi:hypothetical protein
MDKFKFCLYTLCSFLIGTAASFSDEGFSRIQIRGNEILIPAGSYPIADGKVRIVSPQSVKVPQLAPVSIKDEGMFLPHAPLNASSWNGQGRLINLRVASITARGSLIPDSVSVARRGRKLLQIDSDYLLEPYWGRIVMGPSGSVDAKEPVFVSYNYRLKRLDSVAVDAAGFVSYWPGVAALVGVLPPAIPSDLNVLFNVYRPYDSTVLKPEHLFFNEIDSSMVQTATTTGRIPRTKGKLRSGEQVTIVCWGDSVTAGADLESVDVRFSNLLAEQLREKFPQSKINVINISIGGTQSAHWLAGWDRGETEGCTFARVIDAKPDLVALEFVNDARLPEEQYFQLYSRIHTAVSKIGAELILITPHFTHPVLMGTDDLRTRDRRPYVSFLKEFAGQNRIALADASGRWERLYASGLPYVTLLANGWNHPDERGHAIFVEELIKCFD